MPGRVNLSLATVLLLVGVLLGCAKPEPPPPKAEPPPLPLVTVAPPASPAASPSPSASRPSGPVKRDVPAGGDTGRASAPAADGVPAAGAGTFTVAAGGTDVVGTGAALVRYRTEVEDGIVWGANPVWTAASFAATVDGIVAAERGWTWSAEHPVTNAAENMTNASWSFQRVSGNTYSVRIRLATPGTVDRLCGQFGVKTQGVYSCRFGQTIMVNLRRWLRGADGFPVGLTDYRSNVINHEMGHYLGFDHMRCPAPGGPAPIMQTQTIDLGGCTPNSHPYTGEGTFVSGPWIAS